jgi:putative endonuclease
MRNRKAAFVFGQEAESWAALWLMAKGYQILERRLLLGGGEVDLVAYRTKTLVFVEVKARARLDEALLAITNAKLQRIAKAARAYIPRQTRPVETIRCDGVLVAPWHLPRHIKAIGELPLD